MFCILRLLLDLLATLYIMKSTKSTSAECFWNIFCKGRAHTHTAQPRKYAHSHTSQEEYLMLQEKVDDLFSLMHPDTSPNVSLFSMVSAGSAVSLAQPW